MIKKFQLLPIKLLIFSLGFVLVFTACNKDDDKKTFEFLVSADLIDSKTETALDVYLGEIGLGGFATLTNADIKVYRVTYKTQDTEGNPVIASGLAVIPSSPGLYDMLSYQHGTIVNKEDAPSKYKLGTEATTVVSAFSSIGYVMSVPDYLGYGSTEDIPHPYELAESVAITSYHMLKAVYELTDDLGINVSTRLFLAGYSQGGFSTMALHQYIEENTDLVVHKSAPGAGAYDKTSFARFISEQDEELQFLPYYLWVLDTYNREYKLGRSWSYYITAENVARVEANGYFAEGLDLNPQNLFTPEFLMALREGTDIPFANALADNNNYDWKPKAPVQLWHGTSDTFVNYLNSQNAFDAMSARGAQVELKPVVGGDHFNSTGPYFTGVYSFFRF